MFQRSRHSQGTSIFFTPSSTSKHLFETFENSEEKQKANKNKGYSNPLVPCKSLREIVEKEAEYWGRKGEKTKLSLSKILLGAARNGN